MKNKILVFFDDSALGKSALEHGKLLSQIFDAEVDTVCISRNKDDKTFSSATKTDNIICAVVPVSQSKKSSIFSYKHVKKWIRKSRIPVLTIGNNKPDINDYQQIVLPIDTNCQEKELALWASYFPLHFQKNCPDVPKENILIHIIYKEYREELLSKKVQNNLEFTKKMFDNLEVLYEWHPFTDVNNIHIFGLQFAKTIGNSVLIHLVPKHNSLIDLFFGTVTSKLLGNREQIPVFCLNAREDIYVLCK